jgi:hypothetical protein
MADYKLHGLNTRDFQHLIQAIARKVVSPGVAAFGDGPDGGRDLSYRGRMEYPSTASGWNGYLVIGCKFRQQLLGSKKDGDWALAQLNGDLKKFANRKKRLLAPDYYIFTTNVSLSGSAQTGARDKVEAALAEFRDGRKLKGYSIWDYNDIRGFIDGDSSVRTAYAHFITAGDVLSSVFQSIHSLRPDFLDVMHTFLQKELIADASAKLQAAADDPERQIPLATLFVDLPFADSPEKAVLVQEREAEKFPLVVTHLLERGARNLRKSAATDHLSKKDRSSAHPLSRFAIVGGPGQGKSTFGQYLCQLYRAAILKDRPSHKLDDRATAIIRQLERQQSGDTVGLPIVRRFPVRIELRNFSHALKAAETLTLLEYVRRDIARLGNATILIEDLKAWLTAYPWLMILDGLDEVPASSNRDEVIKEIESLRVDFSSCDADVLFVATTRPQGYSRDFSEDLYKHLYLTPLSPNQSLNYGRKLAKAWCTDDERREDELVSSLEKACRNPTTSRLMQSPLQVTIMATLLEETGEPPQQRYRLFGEYYRTIYKRETRRKLLGGILSERVKDIDTIHQSVGLVLQIRGEVSTAPRKGEHVDELDSALSDLEFRQLVRQRLSFIGIAEPKASELLDTISAGSLQRLVFLVRQREGWVRFDVTSFKEFMAAEALMNGSDDDVRRRLRAISAVSYWRNVFQFAVGKCFVEKEHLLDSLVSLCLGLNEETACTEIVESEVAGRAAKVSRWGSRLALDIIADGTARQYPGYEARFANIALQLLRAPDPEACARLASVYHSDMESLYRDAIQECLQFSSEWSQLGSLRLLVDLADRKVQWAADLIEKAWPKEILVQQNILLRRASRIRSSWVRDRVAEVAPQGEVFWLLSHAHRTSESEFKGSSLGAILNLVRLVDPNLKGRLEITNRSRWKNPAPSFVLSPINTGGHIWESVRSIEFRHESWFPLVSATRFAASPSAKNLATELRWLGKYWTSQSLYWAMSIPWPLLACIRFAQSAEALTHIANRVEKGDLGDQADWAAAERRWRENALSDSDFLSSDDGLPFHANIADSGFPFSASEPQVSRLESPQAVASAIESLEAIPSDGIRSWLAAEVLASLLNGSEEPQLMPEQARTLHSMIKGAYPSSYGLHITLDSFLAQAARENFSERWLDFFDWLGQTNIWALIEAPKPGLAAPLITHFSSAPDRRKGMLSIIAALARAGCGCTISNSVLELATRWGDEARSDAIGLQLAGDVLPSTQIQSIAKTIVSDQHLARTSYKFLRMAQGCSEEQGVELALMLLNYCDDSTENSNDVRETALRVLVEFLNKKPSLLSKPEICRKLNLHIELGTMGAE